VKTLNVGIENDVRWFLEAQFTRSLQDRGNEEVQVKIVSSCVGSA